MDIEQAGAIGILFLDSITDANRPIDKSTIWNFRKEE
jgi:hypothetical protein